MGGDVDGLFCKSCGMIVDLLHRLAVWVCFSSVICEVVRSAFLTNFGDTVELQ